MYTIKATDGDAKHAELVTPHGTIETPVFMNVATAAAIKGALSAEDLKNAGCQVALCNTYHLHLRPGEDVVREMGGLRKFMAWDGPVLTDSGGFQVFSLGAGKNSREKNFSNASRSVIPGLPRNPLNSDESEGLRVEPAMTIRPAEVKIKEEGVYFSSHIDGKKIFMGPEESMKIQADLGATIVMAFDECAPFPSTREYMLDSVARTTRWLHRCKIAHEKNFAENFLAHENNFAEKFLAHEKNFAEKFLTHEKNFLEKKFAEKISHEKNFPARQFLFGINQGGIYKDIRAEHAKEISRLDLDGYALGGLAVGESAEQMYEILEATVPFLPRKKPTYLMGVGTPENLLEAIERGVDFFDCVLPARNGRHGQIFTSRGKINLSNKIFERDENPLDPECECEVCRKFSRAYIRHLFKAKEMLAMRLAVMHNLFFYNNLMREAREAIVKKIFHSFKKTKLENWRK
ncbi:MAG: tRNA guanosine(34) transglycosylase Tgt [Defluviitaleaceae bacterium]|nr:tRNA guanosine(34) transglycosylase Tgt [Defluviitaleaceae bacterium]